MQVIPTTADGENTFSVSVDEFTFNFRTYWNSSAAMWFCDISEGSLMLVEGVALAPNTNLLNFSPELTGRFGQFRILDINNEGNKTETSLGKTAQLIYYAPGEFEGLFPEYNSSVLRSITYDYNSLFTQLSQIFVAQEDSGVGISDDSGSTFVSRVTADGLGSNFTNDITLDSNEDIYVATAGGLSISTDGGANFTNKTTSDGLGDDVCEAVFVDSNLDIYVATEGGLSISTDGGTSFTNKTTTQGLGDDVCLDVFVDSNFDIYVATEGGLSISIDGGTSFTNKTTSDGLDEDLQLSVWVEAGVIYSISEDASNSFNSGALNISRDSGVSFTVINSAQGLPSTEGYFSVTASLTAVYVSTGGGLFISTDNAESFSLLFAPEDFGIPGVAPASIFSTFVLGTNIYGSAPSGLYISIDSGDTFSRRFTSNGISGSNASFVIA